MILHKPVHHNQPLPPPAASTTVHPLPANHSLGDLLGWGELGGVSKAVVDCRVGKVVG
jgi:hypothetical protein